MHRCTIGPEARLWLSSPQDHAWMPKYARSIMHSYNTALCTIAMRDALAVGLHRAKAGSHATSAQTFTLYSPSSKPARPMAKDDCKKNVQV
ncbi:hypothetical protein VTO42DRAFT_4961 [Malbranchea cinnamomea]